jgi:FtsP/CotA-like multicopper oxidase with cupredoxin domain
MKEFELSPGQRIDAVGPPAGEYAIATLPLKNTAWREVFPGQQIATIASAGRPVSAVPMRRCRASALRSRDGSTRCERARSRGNSRTDDRSVFMIDGRVLDDGRDDQTVKLGDTEEWTIVNTDQQYHSFHIHQTAFLVGEANGLAQDEDSLRDTMPIPPATEEAP